MPADFLNNVKSFWTKLRVLPSLGLFNVARVGIYRVLIKAGIHPVLRISSDVPSRPFFEKSSSVLALTLVARNDWVGQFGQIFGRSKKIAVTDSGCPDWFHSYQTGGRADDASDWWKIGDFDKDTGDIKAVWECSRFDWAIPIAQRASLGDDAELERLNRWLDDWCAQNPCYSGVNWKCGQEAGFRVLHLAATLVVLGQEKLTDGMSQLIRAHLRRIAPTMQYAIGQCNNHGTTEAAALFVGGSLLGEEGKAWQQKGRRWLENRVANLIEADGTFSQYSVTYHRLMLDTVSFVEVWRRSHDLPSFSRPFMEKMRAASRWLYELTDCDTGDAPNLGANDGAHILNFTNCGYRDFRPSVQLAGYLFHGKAYFTPGPWDEMWKWLKFSPDANDDGLTERSSCTFSDGGIHLLRNDRAELFFRFPKFRYRPSQSDALHCDFRIENVNVLRDGGSYSYNTSDDSLTYFNGVASHNTIQFDGRDQMPRLGKFLFGSWLKAHDVVDAVGKDGIVSAEAGYTDYLGASHHRKVYLHEDELMVHDCISGFQDSAVLRWRLCPGDWKVSEHSISLNDFRIEISASTTIQDFRIVKGRESLYYLEEGGIPVLEVVISEPATFTTHFTY